MGNVGSLLGDLKHLTFVLNRKAQYKAVLSEIRKFLTQARPSNQSNPESAAAASLRYILWL